MMKTSREQRQAMHRLFKRSPLYINSYGRFTSQDMSGDVINAGPISYKQFRKGVSVGYDCLMVHWCGMWIGIEQDGYTHS